MMPISDFRGLSNLHFGLFWTFSLWSLSVTKDWRCLYCSIQSSKWRRSAVHLTSLFILFIVAIFVFWMILWCFLSIICYNCNLHFGLFWKFSLWCISVTKDWRWLYFSIQSSKWRRSAMHLTFLFILSIAAVFVFWMILQCFLPIICYNCP